LIRPSHDFFNTSEASSGAMTPINHTQPLGKFDTLSSSR
jgi:hypothetical protein